MVSSNVKLDSGESQEGLTKTLSEISEEILEKFRDLKGSNNYIPHPRTISQIIYYASSRAERQLDSDPRTCGLILSGARATEKKISTWHECSPKGAKKELVKFQETIRKFSKNLYKGMHRNTYLYLDEAGFKIEELERFLFSYILMANKAERKLDDFIKNNSQLANTTKGKAEKLAPFEMAKILADEYYKTTNDNPAIGYTSNEEKCGATGKFYEFVKNIFSILKVEANAATYTKKAVKYWKENNSDRIMRKRRSRR